MADINKYFDKQYEQQDFSALADAPVDAIAGISASDAEALQKALGIKTIRDLANHKVIAVAQAVVALAK